MIHRLMRRELAIALGVLAAAVPAAGADTPLGDPSANREMSTTTFEACATDATGPSCVTSAVADIDKARALEGVGPITVPTNWGSLSVPLQLLVIANLERVDRGLAPADGLVGSLNAIAQAGADSDADPQPVNGLEGSANWAGGYTSPLEADFGWMYDDGLGSPNVDCTQSDQSGCWGHRHDILGVFPFASTPGPPPVVMGAAEALNTPASPSMAELFEFGDTTDTVDVSPSRATLVLALPIGVSANDLTVTGGSTQPLTIWASGENMNVTTSISSGWSVSPAGCNLTAGQSCTLTIGAAEGAGSGTLTLTGPNGNQTVALVSQAKTTLSLTASSRALVAGRKATLTGTLASAGGGAGGQSVTLSEQTAGSHTSTLTGHTGAAGTVTFTVAPRANTTYSLSFAGTPALTASASPALTVSASPKITISPKLRRRPHVTGRVSPSLPGARIKLQRHAGRSWKTVATVKLGRSGRFTFAVKVGGRYRVLTPATSTNASGTSATFALVS